MYYQVSKEFFDKLPNACFGAVAVRGLDNTHEIPELEQMLAENVAACETYFAGKKPKETEDILPYRAAFTSLGINPNKFLCSIEALLTRIAKGKGMPHINPIVDLGNAVSLKYTLPMGAHDLSAGSDDICAACPNTQDGVCATAEKVARYDREVLRHCGLSTGDTLPFRELEARVRETILLPGKREEICGDCQWSSLCR